MSERTAGKRQARLEGQASRRVDTSSSETLSREDQAIVALYVRKVMREMPQVAGAFREYIAAAGDPYLSLIHI